jgi:hypothetical protein
MQNTANAEKPKVTALTAINTAKILTIFCLLAFAALFGIQDLP